MSHLVLDQDHTLTGVHHGSIRVRKGSFVMVGMLYGTLELQATATALVVGWQKGGVVVTGGALVVAVASRAPWTTAVYSRCVVPWKA